MPTDALGSSSTAAPSDPDARGDVGASGTIVIAAVLIAMSVLLSSFGLTVAMDRSGDLLAQVLMKTNFAISGAIARAKGPTDKAGPREILPPPGPTQLNTVGSPVRGPATAKITLVEFGDFQSSLCARVTPTLRKVRKRYGDDVRIVFKHLPLSIHPKSPAAHRAAEAAHRQGKFWELHDKFFAHQGAMSEEKYREWASELGLDMGQFGRDLASAEVRRKVDADLREAKKMYLGHAPVFFINGERMESSKTFADFESAIDRALAAMDAPSE